MKALLDWFDDRTGVRKLLHEALYERIPGGARWRYVWGSTLVFAFVTQAITGTFLWMSYSPSGQTAWESVYYIQHEMQWGWLLRGVHHFFAQAMVVLLALHLLQVVIDGAYRAPREVNFWLGLVLMKIVLGLSLTGYLLPWDQKGYWATRVATNLMGLVPIIGTDLQRLVVGGSDYGHHTLTRFFALHAGVLPALLVAFLALHIAVFRKHGIHAVKPEGKPTVYFWPDQVLRDAVACLAVLAVVLFFIFRGAWGADAPSSEELAAHPGRYLGAEIGAPADPANEYSAARPEWYFLFLFQFLKYFEGDLEFFGAIVVPGLLMGVLFLMPIVGKWKLGHRFNIGFLLVMLAGVGLLTGQAWWDDNRSQYAEAPAGDDEAAQHARTKHEASARYLEAVAGAEESAERIVELIEGADGIPPAGAVSLLQGDPKTQGPLLFAQHCASCHQLELPGGHKLASADPTAPNLTNFASRAWIAGVLDKEKVAGPDYFGGTSHSEGDMVGFIRDSFEATPEEIELMAIALSAEGGLPYQAGLEADAADQIAAGAELIRTKGCTDCHQYQDAGDVGSAPTLTGYGSLDWIRGMIANPSHESYYRDTNDRMPAFAPDAENPQTNQLSALQLDLLANWLRHDWYESDGAAAEVAAAPEVDTSAAEPADTDTAADGTTPDEAADATAPDESVSDENVSEETSPDAVPSEESPPDATAPDASSDDEPTPEPTTPDETPPEASAPDAPVPGESAPGETPPAEPATSEPAPPAADQLPTQSSPPGSLPESTPTEEAVPSP